MSDPIHRRGPFLWLTPTTWVRYDAIRVIHERTSGEGTTYADVVVAGLDRPLLCEYGVQAISDAVVEASNAEQAGVGLHRGQGMRHAGLG